MSTELACTCGEGGQSTGNRQEIIEKRMAPLFGLTVQEVHVLLDLLTDVLGEIMGNDDREFDSDPTEHMLAARSGRTAEWTGNFLAAWEKITDDLDKVDWWKLPEFTPQGGTGT